MMIDLKKGDKIRVRITATVDHIDVAGTMKDPEIMVWVKLGSSELGFALKNVEKVETESAP